MATLYKSTGEIENVDIGLDVLKSCYEIIGCDTIEVITISAEEAMIVDECGKLKPHHFNINATHIVRKNIADFDYIAGNAIIVKTPEEFD